VTLGSIVSCKVRLVTARNIANSTVKLLILLSLLVDSFLGLLIAPISSALRSTDTIRRLGTLTSLILGLVRTILLFDRGSHSLELLAGEIKVTSNIFCQSTVTA
jgi:hypothetical protein